MRKIARYVKDKQTISLPFAIRSSTSLPAQIIGLEDRGLIREGYKADLVVFDFERLRDHATVMDPDRPSEGIEYVIVNGQFTVDERELTGALPGVVIRGEARRPRSPPHPEGPLMVRNLILPILLGSIVGCAASPTLEEQIQAELDALDGTTSV